MTIGTTAAHTGAASTAPAGYGLAVTPSDATVLYATRALYVGTTGNVTVTDLNGNVTYANVPAGAILPIQVTKVLSTGTTASNIVALY
jgi:hypothetical protein